MLEHDYREVGKYSISIRFERGGSFEIPLPKSVDVSSSSLRQKITIGPIPNPPDPAPAPDFKSPQPPKLEIDWGDGRVAEVITISTGGIPADKLKKDFPTLGTKTISLTITTVTGDNKRIYTGSQVVTLK